MSRPRWMDPGSDPHSHARPQKQHGFGPTSDGIEAHRNKRYDTAARKANNATAHATAQDTVPAHKAAARAHEVAANAAGKAGIQMRVSGHAQQAAVHNMKASAKAASAQVSKGSFGTDPATGNPQSKAQVVTTKSGMKQAAWKQHAAPLTAHVDSSSRDKIQNANVNARLDEAKKHLTSKVAGGFNNTHDQAAATANARNATAQAHAREGSSDKHMAATDHRIAATAHGNAANKYPYGSKEYQSHVSSADYHGQKAHELEAKKLHPTNLGAKVTPQVPAMRGTSALGLKTSSAKTNPLNASQHHVAGDSAFKNHDTQHASTFAHTQSAKAAAKPSLASHSLAAKAHDKAALAHGGATSPQGRDHLLYAISHREQARAHSQRIMKLKKLGPGQHHGRGGRFEGTPGGAK